MRILILTALLLTCGALFAGDKVYQWTDADGNTHFSESPPPAGTEAVERNLEPIPNVGTVDPYLDEEDTRKLSTDRAASENDKLVQRRMEATTYEEQQAIECQTAQGVIDKLSSGKLAKVAGRDGTMYIMGDAEREDRIRTTQKYIDENCR